jgi:predicted  nucleic acid-binding Zn-ribbon protein
MSEELTREEMRRLQGSLAELQRIDSELQRVRERLAKVPQRVAALRSRLAEEESRVTEFASKAENHLRERRECEREAEVRREKIRQLESQLFKVKTQREYDAIGVEVAGLRGQISDLEDRELSLIDDEDRHAAEERRMRESLAQLKRETEAEIARLEANRAEDERTVAALESDRPRFTEGLPDDVLVRYDILRERYPDSAVVQATDQKTCGGCSMQLVSQTLLSLDLGVRFTFCEHCGRLLLPQSSQA